MVERDDSGAVPRENVLRVLEHGCASMATSGLCVMLVKDGMPEAYKLPPMVPRRMLQRLARKYDLRLEWFYHPEMIGDGSGLRQ